MLLAVVTTAGTALVAKAATWRARDTDDPVTLQARAWQCLAAGPLTAASAALGLAIGTGASAAITATQPPAQPPRQLPPGPPPEPPHEPEPDGTRAGRIHREDLTGYPAAPG